MARMEYTDAEEKWQCYSSRKEGYDRPYLEMRTIYDDLCRPLIGTCMADVAYNMHVGPLGLHEISARIRSECDRGRSTYQKYCTRVSLGTPRN
ncbi:hypothetical protein DTO271D3_6041 [Paecilomyces variotii]|nr:hypothetical protein DTO271D3_6041 [Paecilomyces variotii]